MPTISTFYGIVVRMFYRDHSPPHFHVEYAGHKAERSPSKHLSCWVGSSLDADWGWCSNGLRYTGPSCGPTGIFAANTGSPTRLSRWSKPS